MINVNLKNSKILIVDDVIKNIEFLVNVLSNEGYSIGYSLNGFDAINTIKSTNYDIVLLDIMLPDINGYDICTHIRKNLHMSIPILFVTAKGDIDSVLKGFDVGGNDYISKPVNIQELLFRVKTHLLVKKQADLLKKQTELLKNSNINLEVKVREKTTELHEALNQLEDNNVKLKSLNKAKTDFLTLISHELNTPLSAIYGFSELLERLISNEKQLKMVKQIKKSSKRLIRISKMSILITSINSHIYKYNFINETVENLILDSIEIEKKNIKSKKINISYIFENKKLKVNVDKELIIDVMSSVLNNSVKYSKNSGNIIIRVGLDENFVFIKISDEGKGFKKEYLEKLFEFFKIDDIKHHSRGIGLSLATAKYVLELHRGKLNIRNNTDLGTTVEIKLPKN